MSVNQITLIGNLGKEIRSAGSESTPIANFSVATNHEYKAPDGTKVSETEWHRVVAFGHNAKFISSYASSGRQVYVQGRLRTRKYQKNGQDCYVTEIVAESVQLLGSRDKDASHDSRPGSASAPAPTQSQAPAAQAPREMQAMGADDDIPF